MSDPSEPTLAELALPLYEQLRAIAHARLRGSEGVTLQPTAIVHEAILRLSGRSADSFTDEQHLLATMAQAIRHIVVDHVRHRAVAKRKLGEQAVSEDATDAAERAFGLSNPARAALVIEIDEALRRLGDDDQELRTIVELHVFGAKEHQEIAVLMGISERTVRRRWQFAAARLRKFLSEEHDEQQ